MLLKDVVQNYLQFCQFVGLSEMTIKQKRVIFKNLVEFLGDKIEFNSVSKEDLMSFLTRNQIKFNTHNSYRKLFATLWNWAKKEGYTDSSPVRGVPMLRPRRNLGEVEPTKIPKSIEKKALIKLLNRMKENEHERYYLMTLLMIETGARIGEVVKIKVENIKKDRIYLKETKTNIPSFISISKVLHDMLIDYSNRAIKNGYLFPNMQNPEAKPSKSGYEKAFRRQRKGIVNPFTGEEIEIHDLRRTFITARSFLPPFMVMAAARHSSIKTTMGYIDFQSTYMTNELAKLTKHLSVI